MSNNPILVIDDDPATLRLIRKILVSKGYHVHTATNDREGVAQLTSNEFALLILDMHLP